METKLTPDDINVVYQDKYLVAINKPHGLLVHKSRIAADATQFALQLTRDKIGQRVYPIHRLDRKVGGVLMFGLSSEVAGNIQRQINDKSIRKQYQAIVRGYFPEKLTIDYPLINTSGKKQDALTECYLNQQVECPIPFGKHQTSRYSFIDVYPITGRYHQIRKHLKHVFHPIIGDRPHGCNKQNKLFLERWNMTTTMLHSRSVVLRHPMSDKTLTITADLQSEYKRMLDELGFNATIF